MLAMSLLENASEFGTAKFALSLPSAWPGGASKAAVVGAACIAVVAAVVGVAVAAGVFESMGFACATLAARCVSSLLCSSTGGVGFAAAGGVPLAAVAGGVVLAAVVVCGSSTG